MNTKVYVGNLSPLATENDLRALFFQAGTVVSIAHIQDRESGRPKGFAFVEMSSLAEAQKAIHLFNGFNLGDRQLRVSMAQSREERRGDPNQGRGNPRRTPQHRSNKHY